MKRSLAVIALLAPFPATAQSTLTTPFAITQLITTACLFDTMNPLIELPRSHAAFADTGMPQVMKMPNKAFYGDPAGTYFISNLTDDNNIACAANVTAMDLNKAGYDFMVQQIETQFRTRYGDHIFAREENQTSWIAKHGDGTKTVMSVSFNPNSGTSISSIAALDD